MNLDSTTSQSLSISWTLADGVTVTSYTISYSHTNTECFTDSDVITGIGGSETMYSLTGLQEGTEYFITVTAILSDWENGKDNLTATTMASG